MGSLVKTFFAPLLSLVLMMTASGLFNTFVSIRLEMEGYGNEDIGIVTAALYAGILIGSLRVDRWISKVGHIKAFATFGLVLAGLTLLQSLWVNAWYWSVIRLLGGICTAGVFIVIESWLLILSPAHLRGAVLSVYLGVFYAALSAGQLLISVSDPLGKVPFLITAALLAVSILPVTVKKIAAPKLGETSRLNIVKLFKISPHGFMGGIMSGMLLSSIYGLGPVYANETGMNMSEIGLFMAVLIFGGFSLQLPIGRWADKTDRRKVLNIVSFATAAIGLVIAGMSGYSFIALLALAWLFGGLSFTIYPISMAYACERVKDHEIVAATGGFVLSYSLGAVSGPLLAPIAMNVLGPEGLFFFLALIMFILGMIGLKVPSVILD